jgi:hypothetical protein
MLAALSLVVRLIMATAPALRPARRSWPLTTGSTRSDRMARDPRVAGRWIAEA